MGKDIKNIKEELIKYYEKSSTGSHQESDDFFKILYPFEDFEIKVLLDKYGKFVGIEEVSLKKDFRTIKQKLKSTGYIDVEELYSEE